MDLGEDYEGNAADVELEGIAVASWEKKDRLLIVPQEHRLEVLKQHHNNQVVAH